MKTLSKLLTISSILLSLLFSTVSPVQAQTRSWISINPACVADGGPNVGDVATIVAIECVVTNILNVAISLIGIAAFIMLIIGGFIFLTSGGNPKQTDTGKKTLSYSVVGILVAISAWIILNFISVFTGVQDIKTFNVEYQGQQQTP